MRDESEVPMEWLLSLIRTKIHMKYRSEFGESNIIQNSNRAVISTLLVAVLELVILANTYRGTVEVLIPPRHTAHLASECG